MRTKYCLLEEVLDRFFFVGKEGVLPDTLTSSAGVRDGSSGPGSLIGCVNVMVSILKLQEISG